MHFWRGIPIHLISITEFDVIADVICACDQIVYRVSNAKYNLYLMNYYGYSQEMQLPWLNGATVKRFDFVQATSACPCRKCNDLIEL